MRMDKKCLRGSRCALLDKMAVMKDEENVL